MNIAVRKPTAKYVGKLIWVGLALGVFFWFLESAIDALIFSSRDLLARLFNPTPSEFWMHLLSAGAFVALGTYAHIHVIKHQQARKRAQRHVKELELLNTLHTALEKDHLEEALHSLSEVNRRAFQCVGSTVYFLSKDGQHLEPQNPHFETSRQIEKLLGTELPPFHISLQPGSRYLQILESKEPQITTDPDTIQAMVTEYAEEKEWTQLAPQVVERLNIRSVLSIPLLVAGQPIGLVDLARATPFTQTELERAVVFANQLTGAIERKQTRDTLTQLAAQLTVLNDISSKIAAELDLSAVLERATHLVHERFSYHHVAIFIQGQDDEGLMMKARAGAFANLFPPDHRLTPGEGMVGWVAQHGQTLLANDVNAEPKYVNKFPDRIPTQSELSVPIQIGEEIAGVMDIQSPETDAFGKNDVVAMETLADQIAVAIKNARLYEAAQRELAERQRAEERLARYTAELQRSNDDLQHFAYVASHDLQEPLRMVSSYVQLLERRYKDKLDKDANEFIAFAVDGARRMQGLINDLLAYSRIETRGKPPTPTDCTTVLRNAQANLKVAIEESNATITHDPLPTVVADETQLTQVFQNLIANAVKFQEPDNAPRVHISAEEQTDHWLFSVQDNGIGIPAEKHERLFRIFERLHTREEYPGSGIGLAMCRRIVERHGGRIWVESEPGQGATFYFTLPHKDTDSQDTSHEIQEETA